MDLLAHALYGATVCSRTGLAGGRKGSGARHWYRDATLWWASLFGIMPDILSMWIPFAVHVVSDSSGNFFQHFGGGWLVVYGLVHSLVISLAVSGIFFFLRRRIFLPSLAWSLHLLLDAVSHGSGKFQTLLLYPLSTWGLEGIAWWRTPWFFGVYWAILPLLWIGIILRRRGSRLEST